MDNERPFVLACANPFDFILRLIRKRMLQSGFRAIALSSKCTGKLAEARCSLLHITSPVLTNKLKPAFCGLTPDQAGQGSSRCPAKSSHADTALQQLLGPPYHMPRPCIWGQLHNVAATLAASRSAPDVICYFGNRCCDLLQRAERPACTADLQTAELPSGSSSFCPHAAPGLSMLMRCPVCLMRPGAVQALQVIANRMPPMAVVFKDEKPSRAPN